MTRHYINRFTDPRLIWGTFLFFVGAVFLLCWVLLMTILEGDLGLVLGCTIFAVGGMGIGGYMLFRWFVTWRKWFELIKYGEAVLAEIVAVERDRKITINGFAGWHLFCTYKDFNTEEEYTFVSRTVWHPLILYKKGNPITVYVDNPEEINYYYVDLKRM